MTAVSEIVSAVLPSTVAFPPTVTAPLCRPSSLADVGGPSLRILGAPRRDRGAPRRSPLSAERQDALAPGARALAAARVRRRVRERVGRVAGPVAAAAAGRRASAAAPPAHSPRPGPRRPVPMPAPGGTSLAGTGASSASEVQQPQSRRSSPPTFSFLRSARGACARRETVDVSGRARHGSSVWLAGRLRLDALGRLARRELRRRFPRRPL